MNKNLCICTIEQTKIISLIVISQHNLAVVIFPDQHYVKIKI